MPISDFSVEIETNEGFEKNDIFGHKFFGERLANLLLDSKQGLTIAIDAKWGEGKSTFLKMWAGHLRNENFPVIEFNAYVNDYYSDPFIPLAGEVIDLVKKQTSFKKAISTKAVAVGTALLKGSAKIGMKAVTLGMADGKLVDDVAKDIADGLADYVEDEVASLIENYKKEGGQIEKFQESLSQISAKLHQGPKGLDGTPINPKPLIFIVDELDRCRPDYALKLLERVKHFYSTPNVHFIFGVHMTQVENSVKAAYGNEIDARLYLEKFFSLIASMPKLHRDIRATNSAIYLRKIRNQTNGSFEQTLFSNYQASEKLSLRQIEKFVRYANLNILSQGTESFNSYLTILLTLKIFDPQIYEKILLQKLSVQEASIILGKFGTLENPGWSKFLTDLLTTGRAEDLRRSFGIFFQDDVNKSISENFLNWESPSNR